MKSSKNAMLCILSSVSSSIASPPAFVVEQEHGAAKEVGEETGKGDTFNDNVLDLVVSSIFRTKY